MKLIKQKKKKKKKLRENIEYILNEEGLTYAILPVKSRTLIEIYNIFQSLLFTLHLPLAPFHSLPTNA